MTRKTKPPPMNVWRIMSDAVEQGIGWGYMRAHKHTDKPTEEAIRQHIHDEIMNALADVMDFGDLDG